MDSPGDVAMWRKDFDQSPFIVIWEVTRACQLHCLHCRAEAQRHRDPRELSTQEGMHLIDQIAAMNHPLLVFTGGDPLEREDLYDFIRYGREKGLPVSMTPSATPKVTPEAIGKAKEAGLVRWAFSLDGSTAAIHDRFRGTKGSFDLTMRSLETLRTQQVPIQLNTTVSRYNLNDLDEIARIAEQFETVLWSLFFLVPTGRAQAKDMISPSDHEQVMNWLLKRAESSRFDVKTTAAPHFRRVVIQNQRKGGTRQNVKGFLSGLDPLRSGKGVNDGNGFVFISHIGEVYPSGFLPIKTGNIRERSLADIYRDAKLFRELRDPRLLKGKCGMCEFKHVCGGSRARAFSLTGDYLESDPSCAYQPQTWLDVQTS
jgi:radical SAM protein